MKMRVSSFSRWYGFHCIFATEQYTTWCKHASSGGTYNGIKDLSSTPILGSKLEWNTSLSLRKLKEGQGKFSGETSRHHTESEMCTLGTSNKNMPNCIKIQVYCVSFGMFLARFHCHAYTLMLKMVFQRQYVVWFLCVYSQTIIKRWFDLIFFM